MGGKAITQINIQSLLQIMAYVKRHRFHALIGVRQGKRFGKV